MRRAWPRHQQKNSAVDPANNGRRLAKPPPPTHPRPRPPAGSSRASPAAPAPAPPRPAPAAAWARSTPSSAARTAPPRKPSRRRDLRLRLHPRPPPFASILRCSSLRATRPRHARGPAPASRPQRGLFAGARIHESGPCAAFLLLLRAVSCTPMWRVPGFGAAGLQIRWRRPAARSSRRRPTAAATAVLLPVAREEAR